MELRFLKFNPVVYSGLAKRAVVIAAILSPLGCLSSGSGDGGSQGECFDAYEKVILPVKYQNKNQVYFDIEDFDFLTDSSIQIESVTLEGALEGRRRHSSEYSFSLNGTKCGRKDGGHAFDDDNHHGDAKRFSAPVHKFYMNGGLSFLRFLIQIKQNKGVVRLMIHGRDAEVKDVRLVVSGKKYKKCDAPPPPPPPPPVAPKTTIDSVDPSASPTASTAISFAFSADQAGVSFYCSLDGAAAVPCASPTAYAGLASGSHSFKVYALNAAGLSDLNPPEHVWVVDSVAPSVTIDNLASLPLLTASGSIGLEFSSNEAGATFRCSLDGAEAVACISPHDYSGLGEGLHKVTIHSVDEVGNISVTPAEFQWTVDRTAPVATIVAVEPGSAVNNAATVSFQFSANESATFECALDNGAFSSCLSPLNTGTLNEGSHWFQVRAVDVAGNVGLPASYNWTSDFTAPVITLGNVVPAPGATAARGISVEFSLSEVADVLCGLDGAEPAACASPFTADIPAEGAHQLAIYATDLAGNVSAVQTVSWNMDFSSPLISFGPIAPSANGAINGRSITIEVIANEPLQLYAVINGGAPVVAASPFVLDALDDAPYTVEFYGIDAVGNVSNTISHSFVIDNIAPVVTLAAEVTGVTRQDSNTLTFSASEPADLLCNIDGSGFGPCVSPLGLSGLADGAHEVTVRAVDPAGNVSIDVAAAWTVDTLAPVTLLEASQPDSTSITFNLLSSELGSSFTCSLDGAAPEPCVSPVSISGIAGGTHVFAAWATDRAGNSDPVGATYGFIIRPPLTTTLTSISPNAAFTNQTSISFDFGSSQADASFQCSLNGSAPAPCAPLASYTGLPDGGYTFFVQAVDIYGGADPVGASHSWTVDTAPPVQVTISTSSTSTSITINWTTNEPSTTKLLWGRGSLTSVVPEDGVHKTSHSVRLTGLSPNTLYTIQTGGTDRAGNAWAGPVASPRTTR